MSSYQSKREQLNDILSNKEYQVYYQDNRSLLDRIWDKLSEWLGKLLKSIFQSFDPGTTVGNSILSVILIVILGALIIGVVAIVMIFLRKRRLKKLQPFSSSNQLEWDYQRHLAVASQYAMEKEFRLATRHQFLAFLLILDDRNLLLARLWKTNWDYYDELKQKDITLARDFYQLALFFEKTTYGEQQISEEDFNQYQNNIEQWMKAIAQTYQSHTEIGER